MTETNDNTNDNGGLTDELENKLIQLSSMLTIIHGGGYESFNQWNDQVKDNYLWACSAIADETKQLFTQASLINNKDV